MATTIKLKNSVTTTNTPSSLAQGEVAINITDKKVWVGNAATTPIQIAGAGTTGNAAGSNTQVQYNSSGSFAGSANFTFNGTTVTMANDASISGLTVGKGGGAVANNTVAGYQAGNGNTTGDSLDAFGYQALYTNSTGNNNSAFGWSSLKLNTSGSGNAGFGRNTLAANTTGATNSAFGAASLLANTTGSSNTAVGFTALFSNTTANDNTAVGYQALYSNVTGTGLTAVGKGAGYSVTGQLNTMLGWRTGESVTSGTANTFVGALTGLLSTGTSNTFIGGPIVGVSNGCGSAMTTGSKNTIIGNYNGNQGGLDIRTASNYIVLSDGDGNPRGIFDNSGNWLIGKFAPTSATVGCEMRPNGIMTCTRASGPPLNVNRTVDDGDLVSFQQDGTQEGSISVSGTTVSYNGGHLSRWSQLPNNQKDDTLLKGTVMSNLDDMCVWTKDGEVLPNEQLNKMKVSDVEGDTNVAGVFVNWTFDEQCQSDDMNVAMTGDMIIRIAQGVVVEKGDLLMSAGDGTAKPQGDDIRRSKTIAKVTSNHVTCTYADGSYCVPCVLMAC